MSYCEHDDRLLAWKSSLVLCIQFTVLLINFITIQFNTVLLFLNEKNSKKNSLHFRVEECYEIYYSNNNIICTMRTRINTAIKLGFYLAAIHLKQSA